jgi:hypothetical protein
MVRRTACQGGSPVLACDGASLSRCSSAQRCGRCEEKLNTSRIIVAPSVIQRCGTAAPWHSPPYCIIQRVDLACSLRASSAPVLVLSVLARADRVGVSQWAAQSCADAAKSGGVRAQCFGRAPLFCVSPAAGADRFERSPAGQREFAPPLHLHRTMENAQSASTPANRSTRMELVMMRSSLNGAHNSSCSGCTIDR